MNIQEIEDKWRILQPERNTAYRSLRISSDCLPDLYIGIDIKNIRCLILKLPDNHSIQFSPVFKENLSVELFSETSWVILKLANIYYQDLFNDLIFALYNKIKDIHYYKEAANVFLDTFHRWSQFFEEGTSDLLSQQVVIGIFGELQYLLRKIESENPIPINELLQSWQGPYDIGHDFIFGDHNIEVKTKDVDGLDIQVSSEFQLQPEYQKGLFLAVVNITESVTGFSLSDLIFAIRKAINIRLGDPSILLQAIRQKGLNFSNLTRYDHLKYAMVNIVTYDCIHPEFPKIVKNDISQFITNVKYRIRIARLEKFIIDIL